MAHLRKQIRDKVTTRLTGLTTTGARVFQTRFYPMQAAALPGLLIYTLREVSEPETMTRPRKYNREVDFMVEGMAKGTSGLDNTLDQIAVEVEEAMLSAPTFDGLARDTVLSGTEIDYNADGEQPVGSIRMTFTVRYRTSETDVESAS
jgi:hypothetical protein